MKRVYILVIAAILLCGCNKGNNEFERAMLLRTDLLNANGCSFVAKVTADFSDRTYTFTMRCQSDQNGNVTFEVLEPDYISGIQGKIAHDGGKLIFDDTALAFGLQADGLISPVSAPWVLVSFCVERRIKNEKDSYFIVCLRGDASLLLRKDFGSRWRGYG